MRSALFVAFAMWAATSVDASTGGCLRDCTARRQACRAAAKSRLTTATPACTGDAAARRRCRQAERRGFRAATADCKALARAACRPCCAGKGTNGCPWTSGAVLPKEPQAGGDPVRGRDLLLNGAYMTCGAPSRLWHNPFTRPVIAGGFGGTEEAPKIPDRNAANRDLPYYLTAFTAEDGTEVMNGNCLMCHGGVIDGQLVIGLGNAIADFTRGAGGGATNIELTDDLLDFLGLTEAERVHFRRIAGRGRVLGPLTAMRTIGMNPAEMFAVILMVHHDKETLAWSDTALTPFAIVDRNGAPIADPRTTSDPPPWWRAHKKHALFYNGMARGDHRGTMALATSVCVDDVARAEQVDEWFRDIQAFVSSVRSPAYPRAIDDRLADRGRKLFLSSCAGCHGTYGDRDEDETYPNLLIPLPVIGTDPVVAEAGVVHAPQLVTWYNESFYGRITRMVPNDPFPGYMPPPLDGIWATAPYLHNGSVPTIELVLNSTARPATWKRVDLDSTSIDEEALGWPWVATGPQAAAPTAEKPFIYDASYYSQANGGHTFGDHLTPTERRAVIEYLKTL